MSDNNDDKGRAANVSVEKELYEFCKSDSLSEDGLRELFERHGLTSGNNINTLVSNYDFFLRACKNERLDEGIIRCLLEYFPAAARVITDEDGITPLHVACYFNKRMTRGIIQLLIDAAPDSLRSVTNQGQLPLHVLCWNDKLEESTAIKILKLLIEKFPEAVRRTVINGCLPIHYALAKAKSHEFCRVLIDAYPGSAQIVVEGLLPLHCACRNNTVATVKYLYKLYPDAINHATNEGFYPIHSAIAGVTYRVDPVTAVDIVRFLLDCDPNLKLQKYQAESLLHHACKFDYIDSNIDAGIQIIKIIYDAHPEAIEENRIASNIQSYHPQVQAFINSELVYARQAKDHRLITTPDDNGHLPLHTALQNNVRLGSIKLLVKGNPSAVRSSDNNFAMPLHIACQHHDTASIVQYLLDLNRRTLRAVDIDNNTALHHACRGAKYDTIALLLDKYDATSVSKRNANGKIPIDLLWESNAVGHRESVDYTESIFRLLKSYPETVLNYNDETNQQGTRAYRSAQNLKKRKLDAQHEMVCK